MFNSRILYTSSNETAPPSADGIVNTKTIDGMPLVHVEVETWVTVPEKADAKLSNQFYFTFAVDQRDQQGKNLQPLRKILPANIDEATRMATRMEADLVQDSHDSP